MVQGNTLVDQNVRVSVHHVLNLGDERLLRPYEKFQTARDAINYVIACPQTHVCLFPYKRCWVCSNVYTKGFYLSIILVIPRSK